MAKEELASQIVSQIGGISNIEHLTHCATRLRFTLNDAGIVNKANVEKINGVLAAIEQGDKAFQVVIGPGVAEVYDAINEILENGDNNIEKSVVKDSNSNRIPNAEMSNEDVKAQKRSKVKGKSKFVDSFFEYLSDSFRPIIGILLAASLILAVINICSFAHIIEADTDNTVVLFFLAVAKGVFYFLPLFIAYNACKKLKVDPWLGVMVMIAFLTPQFFAILDPVKYSYVFGDNLAGLESVKQSGTLALNDFLSSSGISEGKMKFTEFAGIPLLVGDYSGNVFVPLLMCPILAWFDKLVKKIIPSSMHLVFAPVIVVVVMSLLTVFIIGPIGLLAGQYLAMGFSWLNTNVPLLMIFIIPIAYPFLVPLGLHWPLNALMLANISTLGYDFIQGPMAIYDFACYGTSFGVLVLSIKEGDKYMKGIAGGAVLAGLLGGISEPSLYGIHLRFKRAYPIMIIGCVIGALIIGILGLLFPSSIGVSGVITEAFAFTSLITIPLFDQIWVYAISITVAFIAPAIIVILFDYRTAEQKAQSKVLIAAEKLNLTTVEEFLSHDPNKRIENLNVNTKKVTHTFTEDIKAPISGTVMSLKNVKDKMFSKEILGGGLAIKHEHKKGEIVSPCDGIINEVAEGGHAFIIKTKHQSGILIHVGIDTIKLQGEGFMPAVKKGDSVKSGDVLGTVDYKLLREKGYSTYVVLTVMDSGNLKSLDTKEDKKAISTQESIMTLKY